MTGWPGASPPTIAVVVCTYDEERWGALCTALASLCAQTAPPDEVLVVVDHNPALLERLRGAEPAARCLANDHRRGLSGARNTGIEATGAALVAFLDDDAVAEPRWLECLRAPFADPSVIVSGGWVEPLWEAPPPAWLPREFLWIVGCSYRGLPGRRTDVRNVFGGNMLARRAAVAESGGFAEDIGRVGTIPLGAEETELCIRLRQRRPAARIVFEPAARIDHLVPAARCTFAYFRRRCFHEGVAKAVLTGHVGRGDGLATERTYVTRTLPAGALRGLRDALLRGDAAGAGRAAAILAGSVAAAAGYARASLRAARARGRGRLGGQPPSTGPADRVGPERPPAPRTAGSHALGRPVDDEAAVSEAESQHRVRRGGHGAPHRTGLGERRS
jgi:GT2 family glycosyltransferase